MDVLNVKAGGAVTCAVAIPHFALRVNQNKVITDFLIYGVSPAILRSRRAVVLSRTPAPPIAWHLFSIPFKHDQPTLIARTSAARNRW